jgi:hypothetical protein
LMLKVIGRPDWTGSKCLSISFPCRVQ